MHRLSGRMVCVLMGSILLSPVVRANNRSVDSQEDASSVNKAIHRNLVFAKVDGQELTLDLYVPDGASAAKPKLVVWIHGGGWRGGSKNKPPLRKLSDCGYAVASISYRFTDQAIFPAQIHDCKGAVRWLRAHADEYGYAADWIAVAGSSAGGHLALLLGVSSGHLTSKSRMYF